MEDKETEVKIKDKILKNADYKWFFEAFDQNIRKEIFEIIYTFLFKKNEESIKQQHSKKKMKDSQNKKQECLESLEDYIKTKDDTYNNKPKKDIIQLFNKKEKELNKKLNKYKINLSIVDYYYLCLKDNEEKNLINISCLRKIRFGDQYEWICSSFYLLYFQYFVLKYEKPSRVKDIDEEKEEVETIDSLGKADELLENEYYIYIKDSKTQNVNFDQIFKDGNKNFEFSKENILKYLNYNSKDSKQIEGSDKIYDNNYENVIGYCYESHFDNLIYSFQNGNYFFETNLIICLNHYQRQKFRFFYINIDKVNTIFNNKYLFKEYLGFWMAKLFPEQKSENKDVQSKCIDFIKTVIDLVFKNKKKFLEIILEKLNNKFVDCLEDYNTLVILNNINIIDLEWIEKKKFGNLNILFIFNIQNNYDKFQYYFYEEKKLKQFFLENMDEMIYNAPLKEKEDDNNYYSVFQTLDEYESTKKVFINQIFGDCKNSKEKLLNIALILNSVQFINTINNEKNSLTTLKMNLGIPCKINILKPFCQLFNFIVSVEENKTSFIINKIAFKEIIFYNYLKEIYLSNMVNYLNTNSNQLFLDEIKGPLLEKDIILNILTGQIKNQKYKEFLNFNEIKVKSIYCLNIVEHFKYQNNQDKNVVITQESKTAEFYDFAFKIYHKGKNHMKCAQVSIFKDDNDLLKLNKQSLILDLINFNLNKEELNIGEINSYSFAIITSINVFNDYKDSNNKESHTFFKMMEHCQKNSFEFYIYDYFQNKIYIYNKTNDNIEISDNFFKDINKIDLLEKEVGLYNFINSSEKKYTLRATKNDLLYPIENYYQAGIDKKIHIINLARYEFDSAMLEMSIGIKNIGIALWNYKSKNKFDELLINLNKKTEYFKGNTILKKKPRLFNNPDNKGINALLFLLSEDEKNIDNKIKNFLKKKTKNNELYSGDF